MERRLLIIDDSEDDIVLTKMVLARLGWKTSTESASSGEEGLAMLRDGRRLPSLIFLDFKMPRMDGLDVLRAIRADERLRSIPVVIVTHSDLESDRVACNDAGANCFLNKSVNLERFTDDIRNVLKRWVNG